MKTSGIIRIVAGTLVAAVLIWILASVLSGKTVLHTHGGIYTMGRSIFEDSSKMVASSSGTAAVADVREIKIQWAVGQVKIQRGTGTEITFTETCARKLTDKETMRYSIENGKLHIAYSESGLQALNLIGLPEKNLTVTVPASSELSFQEIQVETASAELLIQDVQAEKIDLESASGYILTENISAEKLEASAISGKIDMKNFTAEKLDVGTTSGRVTMQGKAAQVDIEAVSGDTELQLDNVPAKLDMEAVSGSINIIVPESADGFSAEVTTVSGNFRCEHPSVQNGQRYVVGAGKGEFECNTVSGNITIGK